MNQDTQPALLYIRAATSIIETVWQRPDVETVSEGLNSLHDSLRKAGVDISTQPTIAREGRFFQMVANTTRILSLVTELLPDIKKSSGYAEYLEASYQVGLFIARQ